MDGGAVLFLLLLVAKACWSDSELCVVCSDQQKTLETKTVSLYQNLNVCIGIYANHSFTSIDNSSSNLSKSSVHVVYLRRNHTDITFERDCIGSYFINTNNAVIVCLALAGILLFVVAGDRFLDLKISSGRLNGLIFYAATIHLNRDVFFPTKGVLSWFFSWLNLDLGFGICFYDELSPASKVWLQFAFPLYIVALVLAIFVACQYSTILYNLSVATLPISGILFALAYLKLLRISISILPFKTVSGAARVWIYNDSLLYFESEHFMLFVVSVLFLVFFAVPCNLLLIAPQYSYYIATDVLDQSKFGLTLSQILDMYTGRFKEHTRFWFGLLLLFYSVQVIVYHFTGGNGLTNLVVAIISSSLLLYVSLLLDGVYSEGYVFCNKLEHFLFLNLIAVSALTILRHSGNRSFSCYCVYVLIFPATLIVFNSILERKVNFQRFGGHPKTSNENKTKGGPYDDCHSRDHTRDPNSTIEEDDNSENTERIRESLLSTVSVSSYQSTSSKNAVNGEANNLNVVTSSELFIDKKCDSGEADLIPVDISVERTAGKDSEGVNTLTIQYSHSSHPMLVAPAHSESQTLSSEETTPSPKVLVQLPSFDSNTLSSDSFSETSEIPLINSPSLVLPQYRKASIIKRRHSLTNLHSKIKKMKSSLRKSERRFSQTGSTTMLSTLLPSLAVPTSVVEVTSVGKLLSHKGIIVDVPPGAIEKGMKVRIEIGLLTPHGPFEFPTDYVCVSPILWLYCNCQKFVRFKKRVRIVLPHCLKKVTTIGNESLGLCFMKAVDSIESTLNFRPINFSDHVFSFAQNQGTLETMNPNAFYCVTAKHSSSIIVKKAEFCLTRIEPKQWTTDTTVFFCVSYLLKSCLEEIEQQFPAEKFQVVTKTHFQFQEASTPSISMAVNCPASDWSLTVDNNTVITAREVHLSNDHHHPLHQLTRECGLYPPRFQLRVCKSGGVGTSPPSTACVSFRGIIPPVDSTLRLLLHPASVDYPMNHAAYPSIKWSKGKCHTPKLGMTPNSSFHQLVKKIEDLKELEHEPYWKDLELRVVHKVSTKWREIGTLLIDECTLAEIDKDFKYCRDKMREVLKTWSEGGDCLPYYWSSLVIVLRTDIVGETNLALHLLEDYCIELPYQ